MAFQLLVLVFFVALAIGSVVFATGAGGLASRQPFFNDTVGFATISAGAAIAAYSFLGFDAVTTLTEETINLRRTVPRAITLGNASVVFHFVHQRRAGQQLNPVSYVVVPVIGALICAYLLSQLDSNAITLGVSWLGLGLGLGVVVLALITRGFKAAPPEMTATEKATVEAPA